MTKFSLFNIPFQQEFDKWVRHSIKHYLTGWHDIDAALKEDPTLNLSEDIKKEFSQIYITALKNTTPFAFNATFMQFKELQQQIPNTFSEVYNVLYQSMVDTIEEKIKNRTNRSKFSYDITILNMANVIGYQSDTLTAFYEKYHTTWTKIDPKDVIDYQVVASLIPHITNIDIQNNLKKYLLLRLCKQNELSNIQEWLPITLSLNEHADPDYIQHKISDFIKLQKFDNWTEQDFLMLLQHYPEYLNEAARCNLFTQCCYKEKNIPSVLLWLAENNVNEYKKWIIFQEQDDPFLYPGIQPDSFFLEDFLQALPLDNNHLPVWFKKMSCFNEEIQTLNDMYMHNVAHHNNLSPEYLLLSLILDSDGRKTLGISSAIQTFFKRNQEHFHEMKTAIEHKEHLQYPNINTFLILQLAGGVNKLKNIEQSMQILLDVNPEHYKRKSQWDPLDDQLIQYYESLPLKVFYDGSFYVVLSNGTIVDFRNQQNNVTNNILFYNQYLIEQKNQLRTFLINEVFQPEEINLFM